VKQTKAKLNNTRFNRADKALICLALLLALIAISVLVENNIFGLFAARDENDSLPIVGTVTLAEKDTRHKISNSLTWKKIKSSQGIRDGDSVFTGKESLLHVSLKEGSQVELGENTLIVFTKINYDEIANLKAGHLKLEVNGTIKVAVNGEVQEIKGEGSVVQVTVDRNQKAQFKLLRGKATLKATKSSRPVALVSEASEEIEPKKIAPEIESAKIAVLPQASLQILPPKILNQQSEGLLLYTNRLYDFFEKQNQILVRRNERRNFVQLAVGLNWQSQGEIKQISGQISNTPDFNNSSLKFEAHSSPFITQYAFVGDNYWQLSLDQKAWLLPQKFTVNCQPLALEAPLLHVKEKQLYFLRDSVTLAANISGSSELTHFVLEMSPDPSFEASQTKVLFTSKNNLSFKLTEPKTVYLRALGMNEKTEITEYSEPLRVNVIQPSMPVSPKMSQQEIRVFLNDTAHLEWQSHPTDVAYEIELRDSSAKIVERKKPKLSNFNWQAQKIGSYDVQLRSIDRWGRKSLSSQAKIKVEAKLIPQLLSQSEPEPVRKISSVATSSTQMDFTSINYLNEKFASSKFELEGGGLTMSSQEQPSNGANSQPFEAFVGLRATHWFDSSGIGGVIKGKVVGLNDSSSQTSPLDAEARYLHRWHLPWNFFSKLGGFQFALLAGYEYYRNSAQGLFSPQYDLLKTGFMLSFPVLQRWETGGEILYGYGFDKSVKYEISGNMNYYLQRDWSIGAGYRMHLLQAGSNASSPLGIPYREGYGEAYTVLRRHY
jgi:hypothetical protein